jgi:HK97 family phage major capsid protein
MREMMDGVATMGIRDVRAAIDEKRTKVHSILEAHGGSMVGVTGTDADEMRELMAEMNELGARDSQLAAQESDERELARFDEFYGGQTNGGNGKAKHPGHQTPGVKPLSRDDLEGAGDIGALFANSAAFKAFKETGQKDKVVTLPIESVVKGYRGIGETPGSGGGGMQAALFDSTGYPIQPQFLAPPIETLYQANNIGPLFSQGTTNLPVVRYVTETVTATGAAETAEGASKPEAQISFSPTDETIRKIAVLLPLTDESLEDIPLLRAYINARLRLFVQMREDQQLLSGNGTAPNLKGILNRSGINTTTTYSIGGANADQALVEAIFHAAMRVRDAFLEPDAVVVKPSTWELAALAKDANRNYLLGGPGSSGYAGSNQGGNLTSAPRIWGLPVVLNANMPAQTATNKDVLVGAFAASAMLIRRSGIDMAISDSHSTFFAENKFMLRAEERVGLAVWRPAGFAAVTSAA